MKKMICILIVLICICGFALSETVFVSISDEQGKIALAHEAIAVSDADADGMLTINDALICAHDSAYPGGSEAGFSSLDQGYDLSIEKLWGTVNGGSYGYFINNASSFSLKDPVADGDMLYAYVYTDLMSWSDTYSFFDEAAIETSGTFELALSAFIYDADWNPVYVPVEGAEITVDGSGTGIFTDENGKVQLDLPAGHHIISARSEAMTLVPPVCIAEITEA